MFDHLCDDLACDLCIAYNMKLSEYENEKPSFWQQLKDNAQNNDWEGTHEFITRL